MPKLCNKKTVGKFCLLLDQSVNFVAIILLSILCNVFDDIQAYPQFSYHGYSACESCHVSPNGGGILNGYGRMLAESELSTHGTSGSAGFDFGLLQKSKYFDIGGNFRYLANSIQSDKFKHHRKLLMQSDLELALFPSKQITLVGSIGYEALDIPIDPWQDVRPVHNRFYALMKPRKGVSLRIGKFKPFYGLGLADHTANVVSELKISNLKDYLTFEVGGISKRNTSHASKVLVNQPPTSNRGSNHVYIVRENLSIGDFSNVGMSTLHSKELKAYGVHGNFKLYESIYWLTEIVYTDKCLTFNQLGYEPIKGMHINLEHQYTAPHKNLYSLGYRAFPFPHFEFQAKYNFIKQKGQDLEQILVMGHYYL